jgi:hypothetical protein
VCGSVGSKLNRALEESHDTPVLPAPAGCDDFANAGRDGVRQRPLVVLIPLSVLIVAVRENRVRFVARHVVIENLIVRQRRTGWENVNRAVHVRMDQTYELEVAWGREFHRVGDAAGHRPAVHAGSAGVAGSARLDAVGGRWGRAAHGERWTYLSGRKERDRVDLVLRNKLPANAIALENPQLVREKGVRLHAFVFRFCPHLGVPGDLGFRHLRDRHDGHCQHPAKLSRILHS